MPIFLLSPLTKAVLFWQRKVVKVIVHNRLETRCGKPIAREGAVNTEYGQYRISLFSVLSTVLINDTDRQASRR